MSLESSEMSMDNTGSCEECEISPSCFHWDEGRGITNFMSVQRQEELQRVQRIRKLRVLQPCRDTEPVDAGLAFVCKTGDSHGAGPAHGDGNTPSDDEEDTDPANTPIRCQFIVCGYSRIELEVPQLAHAPNQNMPREKPHHIPQLEEAQQQERQAGENRAERVRR